MIVIAVIAVIVVIVISSFRRAYSHSKVTPYYGQFEKYHNFPADLFRRNG
ncbi:MAG: hypothetical protein J7M18_02945 [Candidatus Eremiobacteraeota bacterium]|nr:hypothetical protein [Candidatus Eremiobacteraeota bacterium]